MQKHLHIYNLLKISDLDVDNFTNLLQITYFGVSAYKYGSYIYAHFANSETDLVNSKKSSTFALGFGSNAPIWFK